MTPSGRGRDALALGLLALLPALAHAPALLEPRLLGPGDGVALHYPLRAAVWESYRHLDAPSWNPWIFTGSPLLAGYRAGAFYPPMALLAFAPDFVAFQVLVVASLSASAVLVFLYLRLIGAGVVGAYLSGLAFALGPYLVNHLGDTATVVAAPLLPLLLIAAEAHMTRPAPARAAGLAASVALLLLAGSPEAARAGGALVAGRLLVGHLFPPRGGRPSPWATALALLAGVLLAALQVLPTLLLAPEAGRQVTALTGTSVRPLPGVTGLILRYVSHSPAPSLALAALPLALTETPVRVLGAALAVCLALQWGRGPLSAPGALSLVFDLTLAILAGLSLSVQWEARREPLGRRLRSYFLVSSLASAAALSVSAAALGPLPQALAGAVGILALALILYFSLADSADPVVAGAWLLPLTVSFLLQPHGRQTWEGAPIRETLERGTATREAIDLAMGGRRGERVLSLARRWPRDEAVDLAYASLGGLWGRRNAEGYDPMVPMRNRAAFEGMGAGGALPGAFFRTDPARLELLGVRWVQVPVSALTTPSPAAAGLGDTLDIVLEPGRLRFIPLPIAPASEVRVASHMSDAVGVPQGEPVARIGVRLASGRSLDLVLRAGTDTGEWAWDRRDVRNVVAHGRPPIYESFPGGTFEGHRYLGTLPLPGRYSIDGLFIERLPGAGRLTLARLAAFDATTGRPAPVSLAAAYVSDTARLREAAATPGVRLFEVRGAPGPARVVERLRLLRDDEAVVRTLGSPPGDLDPRREVLAVAGDAAGIVLPPDARASRAELRPGLPGRLEARAEGPGLLVIAEGWDPGWMATVDEQPGKILRVNHIQMGVVLGAGFHRVALRHHARGLLPGFVLAGIAALGLAFWAGRREE